MSYGETLAQNTESGRLVHPFPPPAGAPVCPSSTPGTNRHRDYGTSPSTDLLRPILGHLRDQRLWEIVLMAMLVPLAFIAFWPSPVDQPVQGQLASVLQFLHRHGISAWFNYRFVEAAANVALFVPLGTVSSLAFPRKQWWQIGALGLLISGFMELGQLLFLHNRFASPIDLVTNALGAVMGALLTGWALKRLEARHP